MTTKEDTQTRASSSQSNFSVKSCPFVDRHKILAAACDKYEELQFPDEVREWMKEIEHVDDCSERSIEEIKQLQQAEHRALSANNHRDLRDAQVKLRDQLRRLRILVEQKAELNTKLERFVADFNAKLPIVYAHVETPIPEFMPLGNAKILDTPEIRQHNYEVLQKRHEFAAEQLKLEREMIAESQEQNQDDNEKADETRTSTGKGRRSNTNNSPQKRRGGGTPRKKKVAEPKETELVISVVDDNIIEEEDENEVPVEKKSKTVNLPPITPPVTRGANRKRSLARKSRDSVDEYSKPRSTKTPEQLAAQREERAKAQMEREERHALQKIVQDSNRRAAATAAEQTIHNLQVQQARIPTAPKVSPKAEKRTSIGKRAADRERKQEEEKQLAEAEKSKNKDPNEELYCYCKGISYGQMIACDDERCQIVWFHFGCVNLKIKPKRGFQWYCPDCRGEKSWVKKD